MKPDIEEIIECVSDFFKAELINLFLFVILAIAAVLASIYGFKIYVSKAIYKAILIVSLTSICALALIIIKIIGFVPVYNDYKNMSYTVEYESKIFIEEGMNNLLEEKNCVKLITKDENIVNLRITNDYKFQTGYTYIGTVVYTNNSKHIVWYNWNTEETNKTGDG